MGVEEHKEAAEAIGQISFAVITVSDSRHEAEDESGKLIRERVQEAGVADRVELRRMSVMEIDWVNDP